MSWEPEKNEVKCEIICPRLCGVDLPIKFFQVDEVHSKIYVYGSNDVMVVLNFAEKNLTTRLELDNNPEITRRLFCLNVKNDTIIEAASTDGEGYLYVLGSPHSGITFESPIVCIDSQSAVPGTTPGDAAAAVTEILVVLGNGKAKMLQTDSNKKIFEHDCGSLEFWNSKFSTKAARIFSDQGLILLDSAERVNFMFRENKKFGCTLSESDPGSFPPLRPPYAITNRYVMCCDRPKKISVAQAENTRIKGTVEPICTSKPTFITGINDAMAIGFEDGTIEVHYIDLANFELSSRKAKGKRKMIRAALAQADFFLNDEMPVGPSGLALDVTMEISTMMIDHIFVYAIGSNLRIKRYEVM